MTNQRLGEWLSTGLRETLLPSVVGIKTPELLQPVSAFIRNMSQSLALADFPLRMHVAGQRSTLAFIAASIMRYGELHYDAIRLGPPLDPDRPSFWRLVIDLISGKVKPPPSFPVGMFIGVGTIHLNEMLGDDLRSVFDTLMSAQLVLSWTAFETLAGDLWEAAVNVHPDRLAQLAGSKQAGSQPAKGEPQGKMIPISLLERYDFDISRVMGSIQRNVKPTKVEFDSLEKIRRAYADAFGIEASAIYKLLEEPALDELSIVRNLLVHKAGVCDKEYTDKAQNRNLPQLQSGDKLELDGALAAQLLLPTIKCCTSLVRDLDNWLDASPAKKTDLLVEENGSGI